MTNDPVLALIEKWEADARRQDWPANGEFLTPQECAKQIRAILPQRDRERDAATRIAALEEAASLVRKWYTRWPNGPDILSAVANGILALRTQSDLDMMHR